MLLLGGGWGSGGGYESGGRGRRATAGWLVSGCCNYRFLFCSGRLVVRCAPFPLASVFGLVFSRRGLALVPCLACSAAGHRNPDYVAPGSKYKKTIKQVSPISAHGTMRR